MHIYTHTHTHTLLSLSRHCESSLTDEHLCLVFLKGIYIHSQYYPFSATLAFMWSNPGYKEMYKLAFWGKTTNKSFYLNGLPNCDVPSITFWCCYFDIIFSINDNCHFPLPT